MATFSPARENLHHDFIIYSFEVIPFIFIEPIWWNVVDLSEYNSITWCLSFKLWLMPWALSIGKSSSRYKKKSFLRRTFCNETIATQKLRWIRRKTSGVYAWLFCYEFVAKNCVQFIANCCDQLDTTFCNKFVAKISGEFVAKKLIL